MAFRHGPTLSLFPLLVAVLPAAPLLAGVVVEADTVWLGPGEETVLAPRWTGNGNPPAFTWSLPGETEGRLRPTPEGA